MSSQWYSEGYVAGEYGAPRDANPYNPHEPDYAMDACADWDGGWLDATEEWQRTIDKICSTHDTAIEVVVTVLFLAFALLVIITLVLR